MELIFVTARNIFQRGVTYDELCREIISRGYTIIDQNFKTNKIVYCCSKCLTMFADDERDLRNATFKHSVKCDSPFKIEGISIFVLSNSRDAVNIRPGRKGIRTLMKLSRWEYGLRYTPPILNRNDIVFQYVENERLIGLLIIRDKPFKYIDPRTLQVANIVRYLLVIDFVVIGYRRRQGIGKLLFDTMLNHLNINIDDLTFVKPTNNLISFLKKHYNITKLNITPENVGKKAYKHDT